MAQIYAFSQNIFGPIFRLPETLLTFCTYDSGNVQLPFFGGSWLILMVGSLGGQELEYLVERVNFVSVMGCTWRIL